MDKKGCFLDYSIPRLYQKYFPSIAGGRKYICDLSHTEWRYRDGKILRRINGDGAMIVNNGFTVYSGEDMEELRKLSNEIADRLQDLAQCEDDDGSPIISEKLTLNEISYLYQYKKSEWFITKLAEHNFIHKVRNDLEKKFVF